MARQNQNNGRRRVAVVVALVVAALLLFTGINRRRVVTPVRAEKVVRQEIASVISTNGKIEPVNSFEAHAPAPATVDKVLVAAAVLIFTGINRRRVVTPVRAEKVVRQEIASVISTNGKIEPVNSFEAHAPAPATVDKVLVAEGDHVKAGQLLVKLDDAEALTGCACTGAITIGRGVAERNQSRRNTGRAVDEPG